MAGFFTNQDLGKRKAKNNHRIAQCGRCGLSKLCISPKMEPTGDGKRKILFVAEAPGEQEDRIGEQLIGDSGQRLRLSLRNIDVDLEDCWKTNAVICRPPKNKIEPYMISCCRPHLLKTIKELKPRVIIALGRSALESLLFQQWGKDVDSISRWVGYTIPNSTFNCWICPTYHPSFVLRMGEDRLLVNEFERHLTIASKLERKKPNFLLLPDLEKEVEIIQNPRSAYLRLKDLYRKKGLIAFDYETTGLKPEREGHRIVSVSFCFNGEDTFALKLHAKHHPILKKILRSKDLKKTAANFKYEDRWSKAILNTRVQGWHWDTMLWTHCIDNRKKICSLKFQVFIQFGIGDYDNHISDYLKSGSSNGFNRIDQISTQDLLLYNGLDSLLEFKLMQRQKDILKANKGE